MTANCMKKILTFLGETFVTKQCAWTDKCSECTFLE